MPYTRPLYQLIASIIDARLRCIEQNNVEWVGKHEDALNQLADCLPSGSGIDCGTAIDWADSKPERIVLRLSFHHLHDSGMYDGWTEHEIIVTPSLIHDYTLRITGKNRNDIKDHLSELYGYALSQPYDQTEDGFRLHETWKEQAS
jgi:hypothetical protein